MDLIKAEDRFVVTQLFVTFIMNLIALDVDLIEIDKDLRILFLIWGIGFNSRFSHGFWIK